VLLLLHQGVAEIPDAAIAKIHDGFGRTTFWCQGFQRPTLASLSFRHTQSYMLDYLARLCHVNGTRAQQAGNSRPWHAQ